MKVSIWFILLIVVLASITIYYFINKKTTVASSINPTKTLSTKDKQNFSLLGTWLSPKGNTWTKQELLENGYTESQIKDASNTSFNIATGFIPGI